MDKNSPYDLYNWFIRARMAEPRNCQEILDCVKAILAYMENFHKDDITYYNFKIDSHGQRVRSKHRVDEKCAVIRELLLLGEDLAWSVQDLEEIRRIIHREMKSYKRILRVRANLTKQAERRRK